ncbi:MAG: hypothetical protein J6L70_02010 [Alphaproteobacteria bacterium]|nr:hypothetical protein [Alphaproteobacteria bacterium]
MKNTLLKKRVMESDNAKKVNPLDLSSDQDLTIGLMNMLAIEEICGDSELGCMVRDIRSGLMKKIVSEKTDLWNASEKLLAQTVDLIERGNKMLAGNKSIDAYKLFDAAYGAYSLFWGINMGMVDLSEIKY